MSARRPVLVVVGMHRSGTSLCASVLQRLGADMADGPEAAPGNLRGHWERPRIVEANDAILGLFGRSWTSPAHALAMPPGWAEDARLRPHRERALAWLGPKVASGKPFGFKDPRTTVLLPFWRSVLEEAGATPRIVFCVREPAQVARSLHARDGLDRDAAEYRWLVYNVAAVQGVGEAPVCTIAYGDWFERPAETAGRLAGFAGLEKQAGDVVGGLVDGGERHDDASVDPPKPLAARLYAAILQDAAKPRFGARLRELATVLGEFRCQVQPLLVGMETMRVGLAEQRRAIGDLQSLVRRLRKE